MLLALTEPFKPKRKQHWVCFNAQKIIVVVYNDCWIVVVIA